jgi:hypothetical protein
VAVEVVVGVLAAVEVVVVVVGVLAAVVVVAGVVVAVEVVAAGAVVEGVVVAVEPLVVELPLLPQAATSAEHNSARTSSAGRLPIIDSPWLVRAVARGC